MKILSLDLSTKSSGYAIGQDELIQQHGCITTKSKDVIKRIITMRDQIAILIKNNNIDKIIMEEVHPDYNSHTYKVLKWLQAAVVIAAYQVNSKIQYNFLNASEWRAVLNIKQGRGITRDSLKPQDIEYVYKKYNILVNDDQADAICIYDAYWQKNNNEINWE